MVTRIRLRTVLVTLGLYAAAALLIAYFGVHAYGGAYGLNAKHDLMQRTTELRRELAEIKTQRALWEHRVSLLRASGLDPDLLDERARAKLDYLHPRDLTLFVGTR